MTIPNLAELLEKGGIKIAGMPKTVKSTAELEVELNAAYAFNAIVEKGSHLVPVAGPRGVAKFGRFQFVLYELDGANAVWRAHSRACL